jgi:hypothetical protein
METEIERIKLWREMRSALLTLLYTMPPGNGHRNEAAQIAELEERLVEAELGAKLSRRYTARLRQPGTAGA